MRFTSFQTSLIVVAGLFASLMASQATAVTIYNRFEDDLTDSAATHNLTLNTGTSPTYSADVPFAIVPNTGASNTKSVDLADDTRLVYGNPQTLFTASTDALTAEFSFKADSLTGTRQIINHYDNWGIRLDGNQLVAYLWDEVDEAKSSATLNINEWYNVVYTADASAANLYINGSLVDTATGKDPVVNSGDQPAISRGWAGLDGERFEGLIDEMRFSDSILSQGDWLITAQAVPEPSSWLLGICATVGLGTVVMRRRRR